MDTILDLGKTAIEWVMLFFIVLTALAISAWVVYDHFTAADRKTADRLRRELQELKDAPLEDGALGKGTKDGEFLPISKRHYDQDGNPKGVSVWNAQSNCEMRYDVNNKLQMFIFRVEDRLVHFNTSNEVVGTTRPREDGIRDVHYKGDASVGYTVESEEGKRLHFDSEGNFKGYTILETPGQRL